jgi:acid phosphatase type 7
MRLSLLVGLLALSCNQVREMPGVEPRSTYQAREPQASSGPWLLDPSATSMTVAWLTQEPSVGKVRYGTAAPEDVATEEGAPTLEHRVTLRDLQPSTQYKYRVEGGSETDWFTTAPEPGGGAPFEVLVYGDNRSNNGDHSLVARAAASERAPLLLHTGDMVVNARDDDAWRIWFDEEHELLAHSPLIPTVGNHEITDTGVSYSKYFQRAGKPAYWSVDYGPLHVIVLDSFETAAGATPHASGMSDAQKAWLLEDIKATPKERQVWVLVHQGPYSHPEKVRPGHGGSEPVLQAVLAANKVHPIAVVFAGHEHFYQRGETDGIHWFVLGGGGAPLDDPDPSFPGVQAAQKALSYAMVRVCGCHASGQVKDIAGKVIDSFQLADCATPCGEPALNPAQVALAPLVMPPVTLAQPAAEATDGGTDSNSRRRRRGTRRAAAEDGGVPDAGTP